MQNLIHFISKLQNGQSIMALYIVHNNSQFIIQFLNLLLRKGYIRGYKIKKKEKFSYIQILLKYFKGIGVIKGLTVLSSISQRFFLSYEELSEINRYRSKTLIIVTSGYGLITHEEALLRGVGGEVLLAIE